MPDSNIIRLTPVRVHKERRVELRRRALKSGLLSFNNGYGAFQCVVRDISDGGARLAFGAALGVPSCFDLRVGDDGDWLPVSVRWRMGDMIGVAFG